MNFRLTAILFVLVTVLLAALVVVSLTQPEAERTSTGPFATLVRAGVKPEQIDTVEWSRTLPTPSTLTLKKTDGHWRVASHGNGRIDDGTVNVIIADLLKLQPAETSGELNNLTELKLSQPSAVITLRAGEASSGMNVGKSTLGTDTSLTYVTTTAEPQAAFAVRTLGLASIFQAKERTAGSTAAEMLKWLADFRRKKLVQFDTGNPLADLTAVKLERSGKATILELKSGEWVFTQPTGYGRVDIAGDSAPNAAGFTGLRPMLNAVAGLQTATSADILEDIPDADWPKYGLADTDAGAVKLTLTRKDGTADAVLLGKKVERDSKPVVPTRIYARVLGEQAVRTITMDSLEQFANTATDAGLLRSRDLVADTAREAIDAIDATSAGGWSLRRVLLGNDARWALYGVGSPTDVNGPVVDSLLLFLTKPRVATQLLVAPNDALFAKPTAVWKVWLNGVEKSPSPLSSFPAVVPAKGTPITLTFGSGDGTTVAVRRSDAQGSTDLFLPAPLLDAALGISRLGLIDPKLLGFAVQQAKLLTVTRGNIRQELERNTPTDVGYRLGGRWSFTSPAELKGKPADGDTAVQTLDLLAQLPGSKLVEENLADERWAAVGLNAANPGVSIKLGGVPGKEAEREYQFGNLTEDKAGVFFRVIGKPYLFLAPSAVLQKLQAMNYADKIVDRLDTTLVKALYLSGWKTALKTGKTISTVLTLANDVWSVKEPANAFADGDQIPKILTALQAPKKLQDLVVPPGELPPTEFGFNDFSSTIIAELTDGRTIVLTVGAPNADQSGYYCQWNRAYMLLDARNITPALGKPPLLAK